MKVQFVMCLHLDVPCARRSVAICSKRFALSVFVEASSLLIAPAILVSVIGTSVHSDIFRFKIRPCRAAPLHIVFEGSKIASADYVRNLEFALLGFYNRVKYDPRQSSNARDLSSGFDLSFKFATLQSPPRLLLFYHILRSIKKRASDIITQRTANAHETVNLASVKHRGPPLKKNKTSQKNEICFFN